VAKVLDIPALGWNAAQIVEDSITQESTLSVSKSRLENDLIVVHFDDAGEITSIFDKTIMRELIQPGKRANQLIAYEDKPKAYDAWDIDHYFEEKCWSLSDSPATIDVVETGPLRIALKVQRQYARSQVVQVISMQEGTKQIEFDTQINWQERQTLLKAGFPFDLNVVETRAEIQFGHVKRPSHKNTSWDQARFETSMHRWVDMSEPDFGAALITDSKYGYDAIEQTVRLTLLKGPNMPDPDADLGAHRFRYAILLHQGEQDLTQVVHAASKFNNPVQVLDQLDYGQIEKSKSKPQDLETSFSFASIDNANLILETVKLAESGHEIVLRIIEHANRRSKGWLKFGLKVAQVTEADLMENSLGTNHEIIENAIELSLRPFEIRTLKVTFS